MRANAAAVATIDAPLALALTDGGQHSVWRIAAAAPVRAFWMVFEPRSA